MIELIDKGGIVMVLILLLSVAALVIVIERLLYFRKIRIDEEKMLSRLKATMQKGHFDEALSICENNPSPITNLMKVGIEYRNQPATVVKDAIMSAANLEIPELERYLSALGTIAHISPLLGLLGTVTGNIRAFGVLGEFGAVGDPSLLAGGISEALLTTAAGIIVSLPAIIFYNYLVNKVNHMILTMETRVNDMVFLLGEESGGKPASRLRKTGPAMAENLKEER